MALLAAATSSTIAAAPRHPQVVIASSSSVYSHSHSRDLREDDELVYRVSDTGSGIDQSQIPRLFEVFEVADDSPARTSSGTGMGLPLARGLSQLMGGDLLAQSTRGKGSCFELRLPLQR